MSEVEELADEFVQTWFAENPLWPSLLSLPGDHDRLPDPGNEAAQRFRARYNDLAAAAESAQGDPVTRGVVVQQARAAVDLIDAAEVEFSVSDALSAPGLMLLNLLPQVTLADEERAAGHVARLAQIPSYLDAVTGRQRGATPPGFLVREGADLLGRYLDHPESDPLNIPGHSFVDRQEALLADVVRPAFARYREFLLDELSPRALGEDRPGLCWQPNGEQRYARLVRVHTTTDRTPQDLHETGLRLIDQLAEEYRELGSRVFGTSELPEIFDRLRTDPALRWHSGEELLESARSAIRKAEAVAPQWFRTVPDEPCEVRPVPAAEADSGTIAYYLQPDFAGTRKGTYFANTHHAEERFRHTSEAVAFHEAVPGHHFQLTSAMNLDGVPLLRKIAPVNSYLEGWGLYAERLADEMGLYSSDLTRLGMLTMDSLRAGRLVVDTGLHALGWSRQQAVDHLREHTPMAPLEIELEVDRYAGVPGQALSYMVGRLEIQRVRAEAERALGERFDIRGFHDTVLGSGVLPLAVLDTVVRDWVAAVG
ncbi:uncharacterized protein (DUF885 family) [Amycolatopsis bartoniae]|uniref:DUF885 domain-containing protein n=1 Tax=Amycolatopsis bartoniae TaxID=941986 RepID=A0A8H9IXV6_9PSEU|nr:uncharacterized protein (DUF885 family) [Amycolatopsis bartoniae]TVT03723.1 DUF885 domain-containing protein [Amycolatopsis bartoniae]GHF75863.1 hypothetical protein GCM10017566_57120 [Amycolatopsis bartoniae]